MVISTRETGWQHPFTYRNIQHLSHFKLFWSLYQDRKYLGILKIFRLFEKKIARIFFQESRKFYEINQIFYFKNLKIFRILRNFCWQDSPQPQAVENCWSRGLSQHVGRSSQPSLKQLSCKSFFYWLNYLGRVSLWKLRYHMI